LRGERLVGPQYVPEGEEMESYSSKVLKRRTLRIRGGTVVVKEFWSAEKVGQGGVRRGGDDVMHTKVVFKACIL